VCHCVVVFAILDELEETKPCILVKVGYVYSSDFMGARIAAKIEAAESLVEMILFIETKFFRTVLLVFY
jgi:hypothetical protein